MIFDGKAATGRVAEGREILDQLSRRNPARCKDPGSRGNAGAPFWFGYQPFSSLMLANRTETTCVEGSPCLKTEFLNQAPAQLAQGSSVSFPDQGKTVNQMKGVEVLASAVPRDGSFWTRNQWPIAFSLAWVAMGFVDGFLFAAEFDFPRVLECRDVTLAEEVGLEHRAIEIVIPVSVRFGDGETRHVEEVDVDFGAASSDLLVSSFCPVTELTSDVSDPIERTITTEKSHRVNGTFGGELPLVGGDLVAHLTPSINGTLANRETSTEKTSRLAPRRPVIVSGTKDHRRGVFFKLKRSSQTALEGVHELTIVFEVPADWQSGSLQVTCRAFGRKKLFGIVQQSRVFGETSTPIYLYLEGNDPARRAAQRKAKQVRRDPPRWNRVAEVLESCCVASLCNFSSSSQSQ